MKKIVFSLVLFFTLSNAVHVSAQEQPRVKFYYYPSSNVYYNTTTSEYWYYDEPTTKWVEVKTLPATITFEKAPVYTVYYNGPEVWKENAEHQKKYKAKKSEEKKKGK